MINVLIADDQNSIRQTIESYLKSETDLNIIGFAQDGKAAIEQVESLKPDIVLMDVEMPVMDGLTATKIITEKFKETKVLMLSIRDQDRDVIQALKWGAKGYWLKNTSAEELASAIRYVHKGNFQLASELIENFVKGIIINSESKQDLETNNKPKIVDTVLAKIEQKFEFVKELTPGKLNNTIGNIVRQEISLHKEGEGNLQFKYDRLNHRLNRVEKSLSFARKAQFVYNLVLIVTVIVLSYFVFLG